MSNCIRWCDIERESREESEYMHRRAHEPIRCENCKKVLDDKLGNDVMAYRPCPSGQCREMYCPYCDAEWASDGPIDCPTCGSASWRRSARLTRIRNAYRARTRRRSRR